MQQFQTQTFCRNYHVNLLGTEDGRTSKVWQFVGTLASETYDVSTRFCNKRVCSICVSECEFLSQVYPFCISTSTGNFKNHLRLVHGQKIDSQVGIAASEWNIALTLMCCLDNLPFKSVENPGFIKFVGLLRPDLEDKIPSARHLLQNLLPKIFDKFQGYIKELIRKHFKFGCVSLDIWTDIKFAKSYICLNLFFFSIIR